GMYGAMEFARAAEAVGIRPIIGADVTLEGDYRLVLLAETREGYANLCQLISLARLKEGERNGGTAPLRSATPHQISGGDKPLPYRTNRRRPQTTRRRPDPTTPATSVRPEPPA